MGNTWCDISELDRMSNMLESQRRKHCRQGFLPCVIQCQFTLKLPRSASVLLLFITLLFYSYVTNQTIQSSNNNQPIRAAWSYNWRLVLFFFSFFFLLTIHWSQQTETRTERVVLLSDVLLVEIFAHNSFPCRCSVKLADKREKSCSWRLISYL